MATLIILRGLPGSGKSTWAQNWASDPANAWPHCVISLDAIRLMIAGSAENRDRIQASQRRKFNDMVVAHGDTSPGSFPVRVERKENGIDLTYERQTFKERDIGSRSARS